MAGWLPVIKAALPHIAQVVSVALPMFTARSDTADRDALTARQIEELQQAATQNAASVHELASQLKVTLEGLQSAAADLQVQVKRQRQMTLLALALAAAALIACAYLLYALADTGAAFAFSPGERLAALESLGSRTESSAA